MTNARTRNRKLCMMRNCNVRAAMQSVYQTILTEGSTAHLDTPPYEFQKFSQLMGIDRVAEFDRKYAGNE